MERFFRNVRLSRPRRDPTPPRTTSAIPLASNSDRNSHDNLDVLPPAWIHRNRAYGNTNSAPNPSSETTPRRRNNKSRNGPTSGLHIIRCVFAGANRITPPSQST